MRRITACRLGIIASMAGVAAAVGAVGVSLHVRRQQAQRTDPATVPPPSASPEWLRRFVATRFNPVVEWLGLVGGPGSSWAYVEHVGRRTGAVYRTPVLPRVVGDLVYVPLPYGVDVNWSRNVRAAGHCRIQHHGMTYDLDEPAVITAAERPDLPRPLRDWLVRRGNRYLRLHVLAELAGTLDEQPQAPVMDAGPAVPVANPA